MKSLLTVSAVIELGADATLMCWLSILVGLVNRCTAGRPGEPDSGESRWS